MNGFSKLLLPMVAVLLWPVAAGAQLRVVEYNSAGVNDAVALETIFEAIGAETTNGISKPIDVLLLQEQNSVSSDTQIIVNNLNAHYGAGTYARSNVNGGTTGAGTQTLIYNTHTVQLIGEAAIGTLSSSGMARQALRYEIRPVGYDSSADIFLYNDHYKASDTTADANRRNVEAQTLRTDAASLPGNDVIYAGDFNIYRSSEPMWATLTAAGKGQAFDPINRVGSWHDNPSYIDIDTQSPVTSARYGGQTTGGMDDRFDFQLTTASLLDGAGNSYIPGSYHTFGNNGTHTFNGEITSGTGAAPAVLNALANAADHLPVVAQYQVPAKMASSLATVPSQVIVGAPLSATVSVSNSAGDGVLVKSAIGADDLNYGVSATGAASGTATGSALAFAAANQHNFALDTATAGAKSATFTSTVNAALSPQVPGGPQLQAVNYAVLDHATASFDAHADQNSLALNFGAFTAGSGLHQLAYSISNLLANVGYTSSLDFLNASASGDAAILAANLSTFDNLLAGASVDYLAQFSAAQAGHYSATYTLNLSDDTSLLGAVAHTLSLTLSGDAVILPGDVNYDSIVNGQDIALVASNWLATGAGDLAGDANGDGIVNGQDISLIASNWQNTADMIAAGAGAAAAQVPEPAGLCLLTSGVVVGLFLRRRKGPHRR